jgi:hypothetical protein
MGAAAAVILRKQRDIGHIFQGARATSPETARVPDELGVDAHLAFRSLVRRAVLREAHDGRYYLDEPSWNALHTQRRRAALLLLLLSAGLLALGLTRVL